MTSYYLNLFQTISIYLDTNLPRQTQVNTAIAIFAHLLHEANEHAYL